MFSALSTLRCYSYLAPLGGERQSCGRVPCWCRPAIRPPFGRPPTRAWMRRRNSRGPCLDLIRRMLTSLQGTTRWLYQGNVRHAPGYRALRNAYGRFAALIPRGGVRRACVAVGAAHFWHTGQFVGWVERSETHPPQRVET